MICLWTFLVLAVAIGSVNSNGCLCSCGYNQVVQKQAEEGCKKITGIQSKKLELSGLTGIVTGLVGSIAGTLTALTNFEVVSARVIKSRITNGTNGWESHAQLEASITCAQFPKIIMIIDCIAQMEATTKEGILVWSVVEKSFQVKGYINNKEELGLLLSVLGVIVTAVLGLLQAILLGIFITIASILNTCSERLIENWTIGNNICHHQVESVSVVGGVAIALLSTNFGQNKTTWTQPSYPGWNILKPGELYSVHVPANIVSLSCQTGLQGWSYQLSVLEELYDESWKGTLTGSGLSCSVSAEKINSLTITSKGFVASFLFNFNYYSGSDLFFKAIGELLFEGTYSYRNGFLAVQFVLQAGGDFKVIYVNSKCGCQKTILDWFLTHYKYFSIQLEAALNCHLSAALKLPQIGGVTSHKAQCTPEEGFYKVVFQ